MAFDKNNPKNRKRRKVCQFCVDKVEEIDYKEAGKHPKGINPYNVLSTFDIGHNGNVFLHPII